MSNVDVLPAWTKVLQQRQPDEVISGEGTREALVYRIGTDDIRLEPTLIGFARVTLFTEGGKVVSYARVARRGR